MQSCFDISELQNFPNSILLPKTIHYPEIKSSTHLDFMSSSISWFVTNKYLPITLCLVQDRGYRALFLHTFGAFLRCTQCLQRSINISQLYFLDFQYWDGIVFLWSIFLIIIEFLFQIKLELPTRLLPAPSGNPIICFCSFPSSIIQKIVSLPSVRSLFSAVPSKEMTMGSQLKRLSSNRSFPSRCCSTGTGGATGKGGPQFYRQSEGANCTLQQPDS